MTPEELIEQSLDAFLNPQKYDDAERIIEQTLQRIEEDPRKGLGLQREVIAAFTKIVNDLIATFPGKGFEAWQPPSPGIDAGSKWSKALKHIHDYFKAHEFER